MATRTELERAHFQKVGFLIAFGGSTLIWAIILMLMLL
jgi:hypothetical protein